MVVVAHWHVKIWLLTRHSTLISPPMATLSDCVQALAGQEVRDGYRIEETNTGAYLVVHIPSGQVQSYGRGVPCEPAPEDGDCMWHQERTQRARQRRAAAEPDPIERWLRQHFGERVAGEES